MPRAGNRRGKLWRALSTKPQTAAKLAGRWKCKTHQVGSATEGLRFMGMPVWYSDDSEGFWTDGDFSEVPRRCGHRPGYSLAWQREPGKARKRRG